MHVSFTRFAALSALAMAVLASNTAQAQDPKPPTAQKKKAAPRPASPRKPPRPEIAVEEEAEPEEADPKEADTEEAEAEEAETEETEQAEPAAAETEGAALDEEAEAVTVEEKAESRVAEDGEAAALDALWASLKGASLKKRVLTYEAFVTKYPESRYAVALWEEAQTLRELITKRAEPTLPAAPLRPSGATSSLMSGSDGYRGDEPTVDFDDLEKRYARRKMLGITTGADVPATEPATESANAPEGVHVHDGGFIRIGYGPQWFNGSLQGNFRQNANAPNVPAQVDISGVGMTAEFLAGGAPVPGLILAARLALTLAMEPEAELSELNDGSNDTTLDDAVIPFTGFVIDVYPDPELGIHFFGTVGITMAEIGGDDGRIGSQEFVGVGYGGGVGFEGWIADQWSLGVQARIDAAHMIGEDTAANLSGDADILTLVSPTIQMAFTFN